MAIVYTLTYFESIVYVFSFPQKTEAELCRFFSVKKATPRLRQNHAVLLALAALGIPQHHLVYDEAGKPHLPDQFISISHTRSFVAIALSSSPVGVDIEPVSPRIQGIAHKFLHPEEQLYIAPTDCHALHVVWGVKEGVYKIVGKSVHSFKKEIIVFPFLQNEEVKSIQVNPHRKFRSILHKMDEHLLVVTVPIS